jgi:phosphoribosylaminoimidazole-succinocarboxamide synthase
MEKKMRSGKVRDIYEFDKELMIVSSDRVSCFDVILKSGIPDKGKYLNSISAFWFKYLKDVESHFISDECEDFPAEFQTDEFKGRSMLVKKAEPIRIECIVRKYVRGKNLDGTEKWEELQNEIFTPSIKKEEGHDENIDYEELKKVIDPDLAQELKDKSIDIFVKGAEYLKNKGITLLDSKFEFGVLDSRVILIDEVLTPDSSRFLDEKGSHLDKEFLRKFLKDNKCDLEKPLPEEIIKELGTRYNELQKRILY